MQSEMLREVLTSLVVPHTPERRPIAIAAPSDIGLESAKLEVIMPSTPKTSHNSAVVSEFSG